MIYLTINKAWHWGTNSGNVFYQHGKFFSFVSLKGNHFSGCKINISHRPLQCVCKHTHIQAFSILTPFVIICCGNAQNAVIPVLVWQRKQTKRALEAQRVWWGEPLVVCVTPSPLHSLQGPFDPCKDVAILLEAAAAAGGSVLLCFQMDVLSAVE